MLFDSESLYSCVDEEGVANPPFCACAMATGVLMNINKPQVTANTPADFVSVHALFIVLRVSAYAANDNLYGFGFQSYRCK